MIERLKDLIKEIEECAELLWKNKKNEFSQKYPALIKSLMEVIPKVISGYSDERMADISQDALYWPSQIEKIISIADEGDDIIALSDALYYEMAGNLKEYLEIVRERKIYEQ